MIARTNWKEFTNQGSQWEIVEKVCKDLPHISIAIPVNYHQEGRKNETKENYHQFARGERTKYIFLHRCILACQPHILVKLTFFVF